MTDIREFQPSLFIYWFISAFSILLFIRDADNLIQSALSITNNTKNSQYSANNQTITQGEQITLHCIPDHNTNFIIWYFTPMVKMPNLNSNEHSISGQNANLSETIELAVCKPHVTCKEQIHLADVQVYPNGVLTITYVQSYHSGNYQCAMLAGVKTVTLNRYLIVETPPEKPWIIVDTPIRNKKAFEFNKESNGKMYIMEGEYLSLSCHSTNGFPQPQIFWSIIPIKNETIHSMNYESTQTKNFNVQNSFHRNDNLGSSVDHSTVTPYGNTSIHFQLKVSRSHDGMGIICKAVNRIGSSVSEPHEISVRYAPVILQFPDEPLIVLNEKPSIIVCHAVGNPSPTVYWTDQYGRRISKTEQLNSAVLNEVIFKNDLKKFAKENWRTNVTCNANNILGSAEKSLIIEFYFAPIIKTNHIIYARNGESVRLSCDAISNPPPMIVFWYRKSNKLTLNIMKSKETIENDAFKSTDNLSKYSANYNISKDQLYWSSPVLQINSVTIDDAGIYECAAENTIQLEGHYAFVYRRESETQLLVYYPPGKPTIQKLSNPQIDEHLSVLLQCKANSKLPGLPTPSIEWLWSPRSCKTIKSLPTNMINRDSFKPKFSEFTDQLLINVTDTFTDGLYYCLVQNDSGNELSDPISITIQEAPQIVEEPDMNNILNPSIRSNSTPYLRCVAHGKPAPQINWLHDNSIIHTTSTTTTTVTLRTLNDVHCSWRKIRTSIKCIEFETGSYTWETTSELIWDNNHAWNNNSHNECQSYHIMNEGIYTCQASNSIGDEYSKPVHLILKYPPTLLHHTIVMHTFDDQVSLQKVNSTMIHDKSSLTRSHKNITNKLTCIFKANPPPYQITWFYASIQTFYTYLNRRLHESQFVKQSCQQIPQNQLALLAVHRKNQFDVQNNETDDFYIHLLSGNEARLALTNYTNVNITYLDSLFLTSLIINHWKSVKFGVYLSYIVNDEGCQQCIILLRNHSTPETPKDIEVKEITWNKLTLGWIPGFDGGYKQTIVVKFLRIMYQDKLVAVNNIPREVIISHVPALPIYQQCHISGLTPNTTYTFVIYGKNYLGHGKLSEEYTITTKELIFPKLTIINHQNNLVQLNFSRKNDSRLFCLKTEFLPENHMNWSTLIDTCQTPNDIQQTSSVNKNTSNSFNVIVEDMPIINVGGRLDHKQKLQTNVRRINKSLVQHNLRSDAEIYSSLEHGQSNSDDPNPLTVSKNSKYNRRQSLISYDLVQTEILSNKTIRSEHDNNNQSSHSVAFQKDQHSAYRIWICVRNQTTICHQEKSFPEDTVFKSTIHKFRNNLTWIILAILIVFLFICSIPIIILYIKRHRPISLPNIPFIHKKDKVPIQSNNDLFVNMKKLNGSLRQPNQQAIFNTSLNNEGMKLSTSSLELSETNVSTPSTIIPLTCDLTHSQIPLLSFSPDLHNSIVKSSTIELTPAYIEYQPTTSPDLYPNSVNYYTLSSTCSFIPLNTNNVCDSDGFASIPKCIVNSPSIIIIPAKTVDLQCSSEF
ncbi:unnamed protein product [Schistosoma turkestanicum]|nr:unnamed protein product [Schistosoma turkestanicum]